MRLAGRTPSKLYAVATEIAAAGGSAEVTVLDALDERGGAVMHAPTAELLARM